MIFKAWLQVAISVINLEGMVDCDILDWYWWHENYIIIVKKFKNSKKKKRIYRKINTVRFPLKLVLRCLTFLAFLLELQIIASEGF